MNRRTATIDASPLIALYQLNLLDQVSLLFHRIHVPAAVRRDIRRKHRAQRGTIGALLEDKRGLYRPCNVRNRVRVALLLPVERPRPRVHEGEAEAVIQASEIGATMVICDDPDGRKWAKGHALECHGTLWVLEQLRANGIVERLAPLIERLRERGHRLPAGETRRMLARFGEG